MQIHYYEKYISWILRKYDMEPSRYYKTLYFAKFALSNYSFDIIYCVLIVSCWVPSTLHYIQHLTCLRPTIKYELSIIVIYIWNICFSWTQRALCKTLAWIMRFKTSKTTFHNLFSSCVTMLWTRTVINTLQRKWLIV